MNHSEYLQETDIINFSNILIRQAIKSLNLFPLIYNDLEAAKRIYEFVRDDIKHSFDINSEPVTCTASEVIQCGHGICHAKSHLLAALLRGIGIPCGFGYQKLILDDDRCPYFVIHGYNFVFINSLSKWIKVDARGNKTGINAQFSTGAPVLAFAIRSDLNETDENINHSNPKDSVIQCLLKCKTISELKMNLPRDF